MTTFKEIIFRLALMGLLALWFLIFGVRWDGATPDKDDHDSAEIARQLLSELEK